MKLVADVVQRPLLPESELARLKTNMLRQIAVGKTQPAQHCLGEISRKLMYGDHPYGEVLPTEETINGLTIADAQEILCPRTLARRARICMSRGIRFCVAEESDLGEVSVVGPRERHQLDRPASPKTQRILDVTDGPGAPQSTLYAGLPVIGPTSPDSIPGSVTNSLLGGSLCVAHSRAIFASRRGIRIRREAKSRLRYHDAYWVEVADVTTKDTGASLKEIFGRDHAAAKAGGAPWGGAERGSRVIFQGCL